MHIRSNLLQAFFLATALPCVAEAKTVEYVATGVFINSTIPTAVAIGDSFICHLFYNDSITDIDPRTSDGNFNGALTSFSLSLNPGSSGNFGGGAFNGASTIKT